MSIQGRLNEAKEAIKERNFDPLRKMMKDATPHLSYLGYRYITVEGCTGSIPLDMVPITLAYKGFVKVKGRQISSMQELYGRITEIYLEYDAKLGGANFVTRLLAIIREICDDYRFVYTKVADPFVCFSRSKWISDMSGEWDAKDISTLHEVLNCDCAKK